MKKQSRPYFKERIKEYYKETRNSISISFLTSVVTITLFIVSFHFFFPLAFDESMKDMGYGKYIEYYKDDPFIINITASCNQSDDIEKVKCVNKFFKENFVGVDRNDSFIRSPKKTFIEGGLCRDSAVIYCTIFDRMGMECGFIMKADEHVMNVVWVNSTWYYYCILDMDYMMCR